MKTYTADNGVLVQVNDAEVEQYAADKLVGEIFEPIKDKVLWNYDDIKLMLAKMESKARKFASIPDIAAAIFDDAELEDLRDYFGGEA